MGKIEWDGSLAIGVKLIDDQHSMLIERLNDMTHAIESNQGPKEVARTLQFLIEYTDFHFKTEEKHMKETNFSGLKGQVNAHDEFKKTLANLEGDFTEEGATESLAGAIDTLLVNWLKDHILGKDLEFGTYLQENNIVIREE